MDILGVTELETAKYIVKHPQTGEDSSIIIELVGVGSKTFKKLSFELSKKRKKGKEFTIDDVLNNSIDLLVKCTVGWEGMKDGKKTLPFSIENAREVYQGTQWLREQVDVFIGDKQNFLHSKENS